MSGSDPVAERRDLKDRLLGAVLVNAAFDGWSRRTLAAAARDEGIDAPTALRLFPQGRASLLGWLDEWADRRMAAAVEEEALARMPVRRRVAALVRARLELLAPHKEAIRRAAAANLVPPQSLSAGRALWRTADRIWAAAGFPADASFAATTRRLTLAGVLTTTFLFWLDDQSEDASASWAFLDRRIDDVMAFGRLTGRVRALAGRPAV